MLPSIKADVIHWKTSQIPCLIALLDLPTLSQSCCLVCTVLPLSPPFPGLVLTSKCSPFSPALRCLESYLSPKKSKGKKQQQKFKSVCPAMQSSRERLASLGTQISPIPDHDDHPQVALAQAPAGPVSVPRPTNQSKQQSLGEAKPQAAAGGEVMPQVMPQIMPQATAAGEFRPQAAAADEAMPQAASQMPAVHNQSTSPDAKTSPGLGQAGVFEGGASGPDLAVKPACDQPSMAETQDDKTQDDQPTMAETQDDKSADLPLREDAPSGPGGLLEFPAAPAGTAAIPKQPQARAAPSSLIHGPAGTATDNPDAPGPSGAAPSSPALPGLSNFSTSLGTHPPSPTPATNVLGALLGSYASATPTPEPELPTTTDPLQKPRTAAAVPASEFPEQANQHSEHDAAAHPVNTPQAAAPNSMLVPDQAPVKPSDMATPSRTPASGEGEAAAAPLSPKAPLLGLSEHVPLPPLVLSPTRLPIPARTPEPVPTKPLQLTNPSDAAVPAPTIAANVHEIQPSGQSGGQSSGQPGGQSSRQPGGQPSGQSSGQPIGAVLQTEGHAGSVPDSAAVSTSPVTKASEAVEDAAGAAPAELVEADTGECSGLGCMFYAAQNMYLQYVMFVPVCQHCVRQHRSTQCNMVQHQDGITPCHVAAFVHVVCMQITIFGTEGNCLHACQTCAD